MTNDTAMTKQESEVMIEQLKKVFEVVRLLDVDTLEMGNLKGVEDVDGFPCKCYDFWKKGTRCKNCTSREALQKKEKVLKLEYLNSNIYQVISKYIEIDGKPYVIELINAMKSDAIMDDDGRTELIKQLSGYNRELYTDALTGIYNRRYYEERIKNSDMTAGIAMIDLDDFKIYNDTFGHDAGDLALTTVVGIVKANVRRTDMLIRMGGDEFVIIILPQYFNIWEKIVKNIIAMFRKPWYLMETEYFCTMSMGVAFFPDDGTEVDDIIKTADIAMYEAKKAGKNQYSIYDNTSSENVSKRLDIENNMRQAVASEIQEFLVYYQPVVDAVTKKCTSCEALVRWDSKSLGFMGPSDFVPLAEYLGLITSIGDYVLEEACSQCRYWNEHGYPDFHVNVNLSVVQLLQKDVVKNIEKILLKTGVNPKNIILEITESFAINDMNRVLEIIKGLKKLGPRIALDDFGTGYSSLNYIKQLPLDLIKVDKTFIDDILEDEYAQAFVRLIVELSKTIGTKLVVEGVEYQEQYELLRGLGVHYIQGFYFGKPAAAKDFEQKYLASWKPEQ